jgi:glycosyltransferase involved in cell wall biosynthesis
VFATRRPPWPLDNGARIRSARLAQGLADVFDLTLITFADGPTYDESRAARSDLEALLPGCRIELVPFGRPHPKGLRRALLRRSSVSWGAYATPTLRAALRALLREQADARLHLDDPGVGLAGVGLAQGRTAVAPHNIEHRILRDLAAAQPLWRRMFVAAEARKVAAEERRCWQQADLCVAVSDLDAAAMRAGGARRVIVAPNGADPYDPLPPARPEPHEPIRLLFVGSGAFWPYERGLAWFAREVMSRLRASEQVVLDVVGERPRAPVHGIGITYHGRVADVRPFYEAAHALVVPVFEGSGTRLKIIEAALLGRPVISTERGAEGLALEPRQHYIQAESPEDWVAAISSLRRDEVAGVVAAARAALKGFTWPRIAATLADEYQGLGPGATTVTIPVRHDVAGLQGGR